MDDLREVVQYTTLDSPDAAAKLAGKIVHHIHSAAAMPFSCRVVPERGDASVRETILSPYGIILYVDEANEAVTVLRIWHTSRGIPGLE